MLGKIQCLDRWRSERNLKFRLEVDGGVDPATGRECRKAGADTFVAGTSFFRAADHKAYAADVLTW